jgi:hypothetical protein
VNAYAQFFLPREVRWCWQTFGCHSDELELFLLEQCVPIQATGCWEWSGFRMPTGYGRFSLGGNEYYAHRAAQELWNGPLTSARPHALHSCDNPPCINPEHLRAGTPQDNVADRVARGRSASYRTGWSKLGDESLKQLFEYKSAGVSQADIARQLGVSPSLVYFVLTGRAHAERTEHLRCEVSA